MQSSESHHNETNYEIHSVYPHQQGDTYVLLIQASSYAYSKNTFLIFHQISSYDCIIFICIHVYMYAIHTLAPRAQIYVFLYNCIQIYKICQSFIKVFYYTKSNNSACAIHEPLLYSRTVTYKKRAQTVLSFTLSFSTISNLFYSLHSKSSLI